MKNYSCRTKGLLELPEGETEGPTEIFGTGENIFLPLTQH